MPPAAAWEGSAGRGFASARISFAVFAHGAFPAEMHYAQKLQKIFPVAEGDYAQGPSCSVEREYCPHCMKTPVAAIIAQTINTERKLVTGFLHEHKSHSLIDEFRFRK